MMKICTKCKIKKNNDDFHKQKLGKNGLRSTCKSCRSIEKADYRKENKEKIYLSGQNYRTKNKEMLSEKKKLWYEENKEKYLSGRKIYRSKNKDNIKQKDEEYVLENPEKIKASSKRYYHANKSKFRAKDSKKRATLINATPPWHIFQKKQIEELYLKAELLYIETGVKHHVDHIYPLIPKKSTDPVGLHVLANLQILTATENLKKSNKQPFLDTGGKNLPINSNHL